MKYFFFTLFTLLCISTSCNLHPKTIDSIGGTVIECKFTDMEQNGETPSSILEILNTRLKYQKRATNPTVTYNDTTGVFRIEIIGVTDVTVEQLVSHGRISICEVYKVHEIEGSVNKAFSDALLQPYLQPSIHPSDFSGDVFLDGIKDKNRLVIDSLLELNRSTFGFPHDLQFCWSWNTDDVTSGYLLYMVKTTANNVNLIATHKSSSLEKNSHDANESVRIELNDLGAVKFSQMTERNIGSPLAIVADGRVLSAPNVMSRIEGGNLLISGSFSKNYSEGLMGLLNSRVIKSKAEIISVVIKGDKAKKIERPRA